MRRLLLSESCYGTISLSLVLAILVAGCSSSAQKDSAAKQIALDRPETASAVGKLIVWSSSFANNATIPKEFTADGGGKTPEIHWSGAPKETKEIALLVEDPDAPGDSPFVHLVIAELPPSATSYPAEAFFMGKNSGGDASYFPPAPPAGPPHHYHFEVFAVDQSTHLTEGGREELLKAISGHVIAKGELVGVYGR